jgi:DNA repair exonuclease SbcCD ATPase subunit
MKKISLVNNPSSTASPLVDSPLSDSELQKYRDSIGSLSDSLSTLRSLEAQRAEKEAELEAIDQEREKLLNDDSGEWEENLGRLRNRRISLDEQLGYQSKRLAVREESLQREALQVCETLRRLWRGLTEWVLAEESAKIAEMVHPDFRLVQGIQIATIARISTEYVNVKSLSPEIPPYAMSPLNDTPAREWSKSRSETVGYLTRAVEDLLALASRLFESVESASAKGFDVPPLVVVATPEKVSVPVPESTERTPAKDPFAGVSFGAVPSFQ